MSCWLASVALPFCMSVPFMERCCHAQEMDASLSGPYRPARGGLGGRDRVHGGDIGRRGAKAALDIGQPVADHRQPLAEVSVTLLVLLPVRVGVLLDEQRSDRGGE